MGNRGRIFGTGRGFGLPYPVQFIASRQAYRPTLRLFLQRQPGISAIVAATATGNDHPALEFASNVPSKFSENALIADRAAVGSVPNTPSERSFARKRLSSPGAPPAGA